MKEVAMVHRAKDSATINYSLQSCKVVFMKEVAMVHRAKERYVRQLKQWIDDVT
jgi:hypothetical protein